MNGEHPAEPWRLPHFCTVSRSCEMTLESSCARIMSLEPWGEGTSPGTSMVLMVIYDGDFKGDSNGDLWWWFMMVIYDGGLWWWFMMVILMVIPMVIYDGDFNGDLWWVVVVTMLNVDHYLIGNFHIPLWKIWTSIRIIIRKLICVPNHQPEDVSIGKSSWPWKTMTSWSPGEPLQISFHLMMESGWWFHPIPKILVSWDDYSQYMEK